MAMKDQLEQLVAETVRLMSELLPGRETETMIS